ncbi:hypothetical protein [uncultured Tateyamaria sp.]|uniref:hypothetical protein n=1 Tax=uncultured Tateyamaria sp. TaxID=455651 RepID=UPI002633ED9A|nr:hypothetical protein [uncultured Tateyamaria sp.]
MENQQKLYVPETWTQPECELMVQLCRYHAQVLYSARNGFDFEKRFAEVKLPPDGVVPNGAMLLDGHLRAYQSASGTLITCGFAVQSEVHSDECKLLTSSAQFELSKEPNLPLTNFSHLGQAFLAVFRVYRQNGRLGHPATLKRILELFLAAGFTEKRLGYLEWSTKALDLAYPRRMTDWPIPRDGLLWITDTFDAYIDEAKENWSRA